MRFKQKNDKNYAFEHRGLAATKVAEEVTRSNESFISSATVTRRDLNSKLIQRCPTEYIYRK